MSGPREALDVDIWQGLGSVVVAVLIVTVSGLSLPLAARIVFSLPLAARKSAPVVPYHLLTVII